jgi:hypothetical protein
MQVVAREDGGKAYLQLMKLDLSEYQIADDAPVILEAKISRYGNFRLELGVKRSPNLTSRLDIPKEFFSSAEVRIKVLEPNGSGKIVAFAEDIEIDIPETSGIRSMLPTIKVASFSHRVWRLKTDANGFSIELNQNFPHVDEVTRSKEFLAIVIPDVIRQIAISVASENCPVSQNKVEKWQALFRTVYQDRNDLQTLEPENWADEIAEAFSKSEAFIASYANSLRRGAE